VSTPCTEGTGSFCRVPSRGFSLTPSDARLAHLCRIAVRADVSSASGFSWPGEGGLPDRSAVALAGRGCLTPRSAISRRPARINLHVGSRNINRVPIGYALGPRLRSRLTLGGLTFPRKPCAFGGGASHPPCRYSFRHTHSLALQWSLPSTFAASQSKSGFEISGGASELASSGGTSESTLRPFVGLPSFGAVSRSPPGLRRASILWLCLQISFQLSLSFDLPAVS